MPDRRADLRFLFSYVCARLYRLTGLQRLQFYGVVFGSHDVSDLATAVLGRRLHATFADCFGFCDASRWRPTTHGRAPLLQFHSVSFQLTPKQLRGMEERHCASGCSTIGASLDPDFILSLAIDINPLLNRHVQAALLMHVYRMGSLRRLAVSSYFMLTFHLPPGVLYSQLKSLCIGDSDVSVEGTREFKAFWGDGNLRLPALQCYWGPLDLSVEADTRNSWHMEGLSNLPWELGG